ncbi:MAG: hypothetical protein VX899_17795 [Myxococcota bacterium]|nr:hypothetical protein [Myxococcota bacterium]
MALRARFRKLRLLLTDPARWSAEKYAGSSAMYLSAVMPGTWRQDLGPQASADPTLDPKPPKR